MADKRNEDAVYIVWWPGSNIAKVGYTYALRWRKFTARGALIVYLQKFPTSTEAFEDEADLHSRLLMAAPRAFDRREASTKFLGNSGSGWLECYEINLEDLKEVAGIG